MPECWISCSPRDLIELADTLLSPWVLDKCDDITLRLFTLNCRKLGLYDLYKFLAMIEAHALKVALAEIEESREESTFSPHNPSR
jgi:hypothetical protein